MRDDRHEVSPEQLDEALRAVPERLPREVRLAENGGASGISMISGMLLDYVAALSAARDPGLEERDTWAALRTAAATAATYARACTARPGELVECDVDYLGVGFGFRTEFEERPHPRDVAHAFHLALVCRDERGLASLPDLVDRLPEDRRDARVRALKAYWLEQRLDDDAPAVVRAIVERDQAAFDAALAALLDGHREKAGGVRDLIAWEAVAMAAAAHGGAGLSVNAESAYLPPRLVEGSGPRTVPMAGPLPRPPFDAKRAARWLEGYAEHSIEKLAYPFDPKILTRYRSRVFGDYAKDRLRGFAFRSVLDPRAEDLLQWSELVLACQAAANAFRLAAAPPGTEVELTLGDVTGAVPSGGPTGSTRAYEYLRALSLAFVVRDEAALADLGAVGDAVFGARPDLADRVRYARALRAYVNGGDPRAALDEALRGGDGTDHWECLRHPLARLLDRLVENDPDGFHEALAQALELFRQYHSAGERADAPGNQVALDALGLACLAHDRGWPVAVESDYLPRRLVEGAWRGAPPDLSPFR
ncbi:immunity 49 family protein [Spirillospora sp. NPDC050679]